MIRAIQLETQIPITSMAEGGKGTEKGAAEAEQLETTLHHMDSVCRYGLFRVKKI